MTFAYPHAAHHRPRPPMKLSHYVLMFSISLHLLLFLQTDDQPCPVCGHDYVQKLHTEAEYAAEKKQLQQEFDKRKAKYNSLKTKAARESAGMKNPPRLVTKSKILKILPYKLEDIPDSHKVLLMFPTRKYMPDI